MSKNYEDRLRVIEKDIQKAQIELSVNQKQLDELRKQRQDIENKCQEEFKCSVTELASLIEDKEKELLRNLNELENNMRDIDD